MSNMRSASSNTFLGGGGGGGGRLVWVGEWVKNGGGGGGGRMRWVVGTWKRGRRRTLTDNSLKTRQSAAGAGRLRAADQAPPRPPNPAARPSVRPTHQVRGALHGAGLGLDQVDHAAGGAHSHLQVCWGCWASMIASLHDEAQQAAVRCDYPPQGSRRCTVDAASRRCDHLGHFFYHCCKSPRSRPSGPLSAGAWRGRQRRPPHPARKPC
jgi:hypothetical protein